MVPTPIRRPLTVTTWLVLSVVCLALSPLLLAWTRSGLACANDRSTCRNTWNPRPAENTKARPLESTGPLRLERNTGFEPATFGLAMRPSRMTALRMAHRP